MTLNNGKLTCSKSAAASKLIFCGPGRSSSTYLQEKSSKSSLSDCCSFTPVRSLLGAADFGKQMVGPSPILGTAAHSPAPQANAVYISNQTLGTMGIQVNVCWDFPAAALEHTEAKAGPLKLTLHTRYRWLRMAQAAARTTCPPAQ